MTKADAAPSLLASVRTYLERYMSFPSRDYATAAALYAAATHLWPHFDAFPYLHITATTKRAGKSRLSELLQFLCANAIRSDAATAATIFRSIQDESPTLFMDEVETLSSEAANTMRAVLNVGYRRGATIRRMGKGGVMDFPAYCPKVFVGIGDLYDTLRDRSIIIQLQRGTAPERFLYEIARADGEELRDKMHTFLTENRDAVLDAYQRNGGLPFLSDRDEEIWQPLFAVCAIIAPDMVEELKRIAVDMATEKTATARRHVELRESEEDAADNEYSVRLLRDLHEVMTSTRKAYLLSSDALDALKAIPVAPWRKFRGDGLTVIDMANLLSRFSVAPRNIKVARNTVRRGYRKSEVDKALAGL